WSRRDSEAAKSSGKGTTSVVPQSRRTPRGFSRWGLPFHPGERFYSRLHFCRHLRFSMFRRLFLIALRQESFDESGIHPAGAEIGISQDSTVQRNGRVNA